LEGKTIVTKNEMYKKLKGDAWKILREDTHDVIAEAFQPIFDNHPEVELLAWLQVCSDDSVSKYHFSVLIDERFVGDQCLGLLDTSLSERFGKYRGKVWIEIGEGDGEIGGAQECYGRFQPAWDQVEFPHDDFFECCLLPRYTWSLIFLRRDRSIGIYDNSHRRGSLEDLQQKEAALLGALEDGAS
jgi:hypothetical protein